MNKKQLEMEIISRAMSILGKRTSKLKKRSSARNGALYGGRPRTYPPCPKMYDGRPTHKFDRNGKCPCGYARDLRKPLPAAGWGRSVLNVPYAGE